ncbi:MAG: GNAT family protein [Planctomycetota bacterium]|nr:GNAT family protein [Planctomycetota bacterium]
MQPSRDPGDGRTNELGLPIGRPLPDWTPPAAPAPVELLGETCRLVPLLEATGAELDRHAIALFDGRDRTGASWTYLPYGPFDTLAEYRTWLGGTCRERDPLFFAIVAEGAACGVPSGTTLGLAAFLRIVPAIGSIEVGHLHYTPALQRTRTATEAMHLMMAAAFELGYRRYEWKCDALNAASCRAALRLGFVPEGLFRNHTVYKGRSRDTRWFSITAEEWPAVRAAHRAWLAADNFDDEGRQHAALEVPRRG